MVAIDNREKVELVPTSCLGCAIRIVAFKDEERLMYNSAYIMWLSNHSHLYYKSWRGRLRLAWRALRGKDIEDINLDTMEDVEAFDAAWRRIVEWLRLDAKVSG